MSIFPTGKLTDRERACVNCEPGFEADGVLVRPIKGQVYLIEEEDLETLTNGGMRSTPSGLVSRH